MSLSSRSSDDASRPDRGLYPISVVTELTGIEPHTLRGYERAGLLTPHRTEGGTRRYSDNDLGRLRHIATLAGLRVNLEGIRRILVLEQEVAALRAQIAEMGGAGEAPRPPPERARRSTDESGGGERRGPRH